MLANTGDRLSKITGGRSDVSEADEKKVQSQLGAIQSDRFGAMKKERKLKTVSAHPRIGGVEAAGGGQGGVLENGPSVTPSTSRATTRQRLQKAVTAPAASAGGTSAEDASKTARRSALSGVERAAATSKGGVSSVTISLRVLGSEACCYALATLLAALLALDWAVENFDEPAAHGWVGAIPPWIFSALGLVKVVPVFGLLFLVRVLGVSTTIKGGLSGLASISGLLGIVGALRSMIAIIAVFLAVFFATSSALGLLLSDP